MPELKKKNHIVPQVYLNYFSIQNGNKNLIDICAVNEDCWIQESVKDIAFKEFFYTTDPSKTKLIYENGLDPNYSENFISKLEVKYSKQKEFGRILERLKKQPENLNLTKKETNTLYELTVLQIYRNPYYFDSIIDYCIGRVKEDEEKKLGYNIPQWQKNKIKNDLKYLTNREDVKNFIISDFFNKRYNNIVKLFKESYDLKFIYNNSDLNFMTSDNPVVIISNNNCINNIFMTGPDSKNIYLYPMSPSVLLILYPKIKKEKFKLIVDSPSIYIRADDIIKVINNKYDIKKINQLQEKMAIRQIFKKPEEKIYLEKER